MSNIKEANLAQPVYCFEMLCPNGDKTFVEVVNTCKHHFTGETMRYCRFDEVCDDEAQSWYAFVNEAQWTNYLSWRVKKAE
jgi:hypothetical protein